MEARHLVVFAFVLDRVDFAAVREHAGLLVAVNGAASHEPSQSLYMTSIHSSAMS